MDWRRLRNDLVNQYHERPQAVAQIDHALALVQEGLRQLGQLGHQMHVAQGAQPAIPAPWPRIMYNLHAAPKGFLVLCQQDRDLLGDGWFDTLDEAKHADGMGFQYRRGGIIPKRGVPAVHVVSEPTRLDVLERGAKRPNGKDT